MVVKYLFKCNNVYKIPCRYHSEMTSQDNKTLEQKKSDLLEEICDNTRAIRRVTNRILDHLHEYNSFYRESIDNDSVSDEDELDWEDLANNDDMYM